ncbi:MAG: hypothetical protein ACYS7Y_33320, partial [Planctomycetota bacterium]
MKKIMAVTTVAVILAASMVTTGYATEEIGSVSLSRISTPDTVETSIGTLKFIDGAPLPDTAERVYDYLDTMRAVDVFLKGIPPASIQGMMEGPRVLGQKTSNQIL